jgi:hypothetical protein
MARQSKNLPNGKPLAVIAFVAFLLALLACKVVGSAALGCIAPSTLSWVPSELLRAALMLASWHCLPLYLVDISGVVDRIGQVGAFVGPFLCAIASWL